MLFIGAITFHPVRPRPRLQLDLTKRNPSAKSTRKTKWTILCVGLTLLTMCVTLVGTMLSIGSQYQNLIVARKWDNTEFSNTSSNEEQTTTLIDSSTELSHPESSSISPLLSILKISKEDLMEDNELIQDSEEFDKEEKDKVLSTAVGYRGKKLKSFWQIQAK